MDKAYKVTKNGALHLLAFAAKSRFFSGDKKAYAGSICPFCPLSNPRSAWILVYGHIQFLSETVQS